MKRCEMFLLLVFSASALSDGAVDASNNKIYCTSGLALPVKYHDHIEDVKFKKFRVSSDECACRGLLRSCKIKDIECLSKSTEQFLEKTCKGIPEADIRAIDPLVIPALEYTAPDIGGVSLHFKNINISGLKNQMISDFQMDKDKKSVVLKLNVALNIVSDLDVKLSGISKTLSGTYKAKATTLATAYYNYDLKNNDKGVRYFEVLPETITCNIVGKPEASLNDELVQALRKDEHIQEGIVKYEKKRDECKEKTICKIVQKAYETVIHNIRAAAKFLPAEDFFQDI